MKKFEEGNVVWKNEDSNQAQKDEEVSEDEEK